MTDAMFFFLGWGILMSFAVPLALWQVNAFHARGRI